MSENHAGKTMNGSQATLDGTSRNCEKRRTCDEMGHALDGSIGDIVAKHERLILNYYEDVQKQAKESFKWALCVAMIGFLVLFLTLGIVIWLGVRHPQLASNGQSHAVIGIGSVGIISGLLIEYIAHVNFTLYAGKFLGVGKF